MTARDWKEALDFSTQVGLLVLSFIECSLLSAGFTQYLGRSRGSSRRGAPLQAGFGARPAGRLRGGPGEENNG